MGRSRHKNRRPTEQSEIRRSVQRRDATGERNENRARKQDPGLSQTGGRDQSGDPLRQARAGQRAALRTLDGKADGRTSQYCRKGI